MLSESTQKPNDPNESGINCYPSGSAADVYKRQGIGVAVENSPEEVRRAADEITRTNDADGVARWIERKQLADFCM